MILSENNVEQYGQRQDQPEITITGAGPAGMFLAYLLVTNGIAVRVLERHPD